MTLADIKPNESVSLGFLDPGLYGYAMRSKSGEIYVPAIASINPGKGVAGRFLDSLPSGSKVPGVISDILEGMLRRRGWVKTFEYDPLFDEDVEVWVKPAPTEEKK